MTKVDYVTFNDTNPDTAEEVRGYLYRNIHDGVVVWVWKTEELVYPLRRIHSITTSHE